MYVCVSVDEQSNLLVRGREDDSITCPAARSLLQADFFLRERGMLRRKRTFSLLPSSSPHPFAQRESHLLLSLCWSPEKIEQAGRQGNKSVSRVEKEENGMEWGGKSRRREKRPPLTFFLLLPFAPLPALCSPCVLMKTSLFVLLCCSKVSLSLSFLPSSVRRPDEHRLILRCSPASPVHPSTRGW